MSVMILQSSSEQSGKLQRLAELVEIVGPLDACPSISSASVAHGREAPSSGGGGPTNELWSFLAPLALRCGERTRKIDASSKSFSCSATPPLGEEAVRSWWAPTLWAPLWRFPTSLSSSRVPFSFISCVLCERMITRQITPDKRIGGKGKGKDDDKSMMTRDDKNGLFNSVVER